jgi:hypothetical protein
MLRPALGLVLATVALSGCGQSGARHDVRAVAARFYAAVQDGDGAAACGQLSPDTAKELEQQEKKSCPDAVGDLGLTPAGVTAVEVYATSAKVDFSNGASAYLDWSPSGWELSAVGCRPTEGEPKDHPMGCAVQD